MSRRAGSAARKCAHDVERSKGGRFGRCGLQPWGGRGSGGRGSGGRGFCGSGVGGWRVAGHLDAEGSGEGAEDAGGAGDLGEEVSAFLRVEEVLELAGVAAGVVVVNAADEPGAAAGQALGDLGAGGAAGAVALFWQSVVAPVGDEGFEAADGAVEVVGDADEDWGGGGIFDRKEGDDDLEAGEDGAEGGGDAVHCGNK